MAYQETGDEAYAREFAYEVADWVKDCLRPLEGNVNAIGSAWRTIEAGIRMSGSWPSAFYAFRQSPSVADEALLGMVKTFAEHAYHLMPESRFSPGSNWGAMESNGLFCVGVLFPEFRDAETWRETAASRLYGELDRQVYPDGMQIELSSSYHQVSLRNFLGPLELARLNDVALPQGYLEKLERMYDYNLYAAMPNGYLAPVNDSGRSNIRRSLQQAAEFFPERTDFLWMATEGEEGARPARDSYAFPYSGYLVMRSGWDADDLYMLFDVGPFGYGHQHEDKLSLVTYAYGRQHVVDPGNYRYDNSKWRQHTLSAFGHNTVMVDGEGQRRRGAQSRWDYVVKEPLPHTWISKPDFDYAAGIFDEGYGSEKDRTVTHRRRVLFVKPVEGEAGYWVVSDLMTPSDEGVHRYEALFHLDVSPDSVRVDVGSSRVLTQNPIGSNFAIWPAPQAGLSGQVLAGQEEPVLRGWQQGPETVAPLPVASYTLAQKGTVRMAYILYPVPEGEDLPIQLVEAAPVTGGGAGVEVRFADGRVHHIVLADKAGSLVRLGNIETDGEAALVAVGGSGQVGRTLLVRGTRLKRNGKSIVGQ